MKTTLTKAQLEELRRKLQDERIRILRVVSAPGTTALPDDQKSEFEEDAQNTTERTHEVEIGDRERALLADVERALAKLDDGSYGFSESTGDPISYERLSALPWARHNVDE